uniref:Putative GPIanchored serine rich tenascinlike glycoprotein n=1 Tax=Albugo laibachii Nc14 TaxID=890382 RepID=F0W3K1_9STRA|nr:putative GPIanchored serine rich tenascinlike glycoprotein [Albugo laibachii Nc14]CCA16293.1 putative GPIanchored serine rich tenascinlike glycoprotein [Albugo laibachii Nc14]|eukprot:CCA16293.1 putative GPIanchored serine rich tenascinlike glycoprotein [Albugo laibachii Nc14]
MQRAHLISLSILLSHFVGYASEDTLKFKYYCTSDAYCSSKFPGTVCISVEQYGEVIRKCTPDTLTRPACRHDHSGLCPSYQSPELGYLNAHCIFVADSTKLDKDSGSNRMLVSTDTENVTQTTTNHQERGADEEQEAEKHAEIVVGNKTVKGVFKCVDAADCVNQAYDPSNCEAAKCGHLAGSTNVCNFHGTCTYKTRTNITSRICACSAGFNGSKCERTQSSACDVDCGIGGDCVSGSCMCKAGYDGKSYEGKQGTADVRCTECTNDLGCQNDQPCDVETGTCNCGPGYNGPTCGSTEDKCTKKDCGRGNCQVSENGTAICYCPVCSPDCSPCTTSTCTDCISLSVQTELSKLLVLLCSSLGISTAFSASG